MDKAALGPSLVLAFLMVFTVLVGITPQITAQAPPNPSATTGCLQTAAAPDFAYSQVTPQGSPEVWAHPSTPKNEYNQRTIRIANNCQDDIDEIRFLYYVRDQQTCADVHPPSSTNTLTSASHCFKPWQVHEPITGICYSGQREPCGMPWTATIDSISQDGGTATLNTATTNCLPKPGSTQYPCPQPVLSVVANGVKIGPALNPLDGSDPATEDASITWDATHSFAPGWRVTDDNRAKFSLPAQMDEDGQATDPFMRELVFKAVSTKPIRDAVTICGDRTVSDGNRVGPNTVTSATANFQPRSASSEGDVGKPIFGTGIPPGAVITAVGSTTSVTVSSTVTPGGPSAITIGTPPPCRSTLLRDSDTNFLDLGVTAGMVLNILPGNPPLSGRYTISTVASSEITFWPPASDTLKSGLRYTIVEPNARNGTLIEGSLADPSLVKTAQDFTIAFQVNGGGGEGTRFPIQVVGYKAKYPSSPPWSVPYETTCASYTYHIAGLARCLLPSDHTAVCPISTACRESPSLYIAMDDGTNRPTVLSSITRDLDMNGHIDRLDVTFNKRLDPRSFNPFRFTIANRMVSGNDPYNQYVITNGFLTDRSAFVEETLTPVSIATFLLQEQPYYDTGGPDAKYFPYIQYSAPNDKCTAQSPPNCGLKDLAGNIMRGITGTSRTAIDGSAPVMVGAWMRQGSDALDIFYSEPVMADPFESTVTCQPWRTPPVPPNRCLTDRFDDNNVDFLALGIEKGKTITFLSGNATGTHTIVDIYQHNLTFSPAAASHVDVGDRYRIDFCDGVCRDDLQIFDDGGPSTGQSPCNAIHSMSQFLLMPEIVNDKPSTRNLPPMGWHYRFHTVPDAQSGGGTIKAGACDVHPLTGDQIAPAFNEILQPVGSATVPGCPPSPRPCYQVRIHDLASLSCEDPGTCVDFDLVYLDLPSHSGAVTCPCTVNSMQDTTPGTDFQPPSGENVTAGMKIVFLDGPCFGTWTITNVVSDTRVDFSACPGAPQVGNHYIIRLRDYENKTWPSGGIEVRKQGFVRHATYPLITRVDTDIQDGLSQPSQARRVMRVQFNGPVRYPFVGGQNKTDSGVTHADMDIASATGTGQGPQGFTSTLFSRPEVDTILLEMDHPARPTDVDNSPILFKVHCEKVQGTGLLGSGAIGVSSFVPCDDPDRFYGWDEDKAGVVLKADVAVVDATPPRITLTRSVDSNHDGYLDGVELTFSEPVDDASFCGGDVPQPDFCPDSGDGGLLTFHNPWQPNSEQWETRSKPAWDVSPHGGFRWDTGATQNDNVGILQLVNTTLDPATGAYVVRTRNFQTDYGKNIAPLWEEGIASWHRNLLPSDYLPYLTLPVENLFTDLAQQPATTVLTPTNKLPPYCQMASPAQFPSLVSTLNWNGPDLCTRIPVCFAYRPSIPCNKDIYTTVMVDGSPPVVWHAATVDCDVHFAWDQAAGRCVGYYDQDHCSAKEKCHTDHAKDHPLMYGNGTIDGYKITFSEPVQDASRCEADWHVKGYEPASGIHNVTDIAIIEPARIADITHRQMVVSFNETTRITSFTQTGARTGSYTASDLGPDGLPIPDILDADGNMIPGVKYKATWPMLNGKRIPVPDTGTRPELTYKAVCGVKDVANNVMLPITTIDVNEEDGAAPIIISAGGFVGEDLLQVKFSEPVDDGKRGPLVRDDFNYYDVDRLGVAGKSSTKEVCHGDADYVLVKADCPPQPLDFAKVPLGQDLTSGDIAKDRFAAVPETIREIAQSVPSELRQAVANVKIPLSPAPDSTAPGALLNLRVEDALTDAGSVTLSWTAPGNDGQGGAPVYSYDVKVSNRTAITDIEAVVNPAGVKLVFSPLDMVPANHTQTVKVVGLQPDTTYHFMLRAVDASPNFGPASDDVSTHTTRDATPPECVDTANKVATCPMVVSSDNCKANTPVATRSCTFKWTGAKDDQSPNSLVYRYKASKEELDRVLSTDEVATTATAVYTFGGNGTYWFHVAAFSGGGYTPTAHYKVIIGAGTLVSDTIRDANDLIQVTPVRLQIADHYVNDVRWVLPDQSSLPGSLVGLEIWRKDGNTFVLVKRLDGSYADLQSGNWTDNTVGAGADSQYRVHMVFEGDPEQTQSDPQTSSKWYALDDQTPQGIPPYAWILIGVGLALLVAGIVIFFVLRGKQAEQQGGVAYAWESANPDQIGIDEATGLPVHEVRCPSCNNPFQAIGNLPLPVTCPNCGTTGTLD